MFQSNGSTHGAPFLRRVPSSAVPRHQRSYRGATTSRSRIPAPLWLRSRGPRAPPAFVLAEALPAGAEVAVGPGQFMGRRSQFRLVAPVDASGTSQVPWRSVLCLCPAPGPRSSRRDLASGGLLDAAPGFHKPKASTGRKISRLTQGFSIRCLRFTSDVAATHAKTRFRLAGCASTGRASNPLDRYERFQRHFRPPFQGLACRKWNFPEILR